MSRRTRILFLTLLKLCGFPAKGEWLSNKIITHFVALFVL